MQKWISTSARRHLDFENSIKAIKRHRLNLNDLSPITSIDNENLSNTIVDQLQKLDDLLKGGVLTKEEFDNAKNKILN